MWLFDIWPGVLNSGFSSTRSVLFSVVNGSVFLFPEHLPVLYITLSFYLIFFFFMLVDPTDALQFLKTTWCNLSPPIVDETGFCYVTIVISRKEISGKLKFRFMIYLERWLTVFYMDTSWNERRESWDRRDGQSKAFRPTAKSRQKCPFSVWLKNIFPLHFDWLLFFTLP